MAKGRKTGGRTKGVPNKLTGTLKEMILQSLSNAGGVEYLMAAAKAHPAAYLALIGRVLPLQVQENNADPRVPVRVVHEYWADNAILSTEERG
jgi:hypothetical protein